MQTVQLSLTKKLIVVNYSCMCIHVANNYMYMDIILRIDLLVDIMIPRRVMISCTTLLLYSVQALQCQF